MKKNTLTLLIILALCLSYQAPLCAESDMDEWSKHLEVYNSDGLDKPVSAIEYEQTIKELQKLKDKKKKKKRLKKGEMPDEPMTKNEEVKVEKNDIVKITFPLYYDGKILPVGFYKIACEEIDSEYYFNFLQGKSPIIKIKAQKTSHLSFCPNKVNCLETEIYQNRYYKINYKTIDYALTGFLTIIK